MRTILIIIEEAAGSLLGLAIMGGIVLALVSYFGGFAIMGWPELISAIFSEVQGPDFAGWGEILLIAAALIIPILLGSPAAYFITLPALCLFYMVGGCIVSGGSSGCIDFLNIVGGLVMGAGLAVIPAAILSAVTS